MKHYAVKRLLQLIPILFAITFLSYGMMRLAGSDVVEQKMENTDGTVSQEMIDAAREELGLDKPFIVQYVTWLGKLARGDMGVSYVSGKPVFSTFVSKLQTACYVAAGRRFHFADGDRFDPAWNLVGCEPEQGGRLCDPHGKLRWEFSA